MSQGQGFVVVFILIPAVVTLGVCLLTGSLLQRCPINDFVFDFGFILVGAVGCFLFSRYPGLVTWFIAFQLLVGISAAIRRGPALWYWRARMSKIQGGKEGAGAT